MTTIELKQPWPVQGERLEIAQTGIELIREPLLNKGTAFTQEERTRLNLHGLLPYHATTLELQSKRIMRSVRSRATPLDQYVELSQLHDRNEHLFYHLLTEHLEELMPIVYTPTVAEATTHFSSVFRRGRGVWLSPAFKGRLARVLREAAGDRPIRLMVATDNEAILGIGDQGAGGMAISVGKLALYTACAGIPPAAALPISLDVGTDNESLLADEMYLGWREPRLRGADYEAFIEEFVDAVKRVFPGALVQWEDLRKDNALRVLDRFRDSVQSFNDDIQGTGAVALAGVLSALRQTGGSIAEQRFVVDGAGAAGLGIARQIGSALIAAGVRPEEVRERIAALDSRGLLVEGAEIREEYKRDLAWRRDYAASLGLGDGADRKLESVVRAFRPTVLIGTSGQPQLFTERIVHNMAEHAKHPLIMPFSNPTDRTEAAPADLLRWTGGRAIVATGSPFAPVEVDGRPRRIGQGNNVFVFPGVGLGVLLGGFSKVTDDMLTAAAHAVAGCVTDAELEQGLIYPAVRRLHVVTRAVAAAVIRCGAGLAAAEAHADDLEERIERAMWKPRYADYWPLPTG